MQPFSGGHPFIPLHDSELAVFLSQSTVCAFLLVSRCFSWKAGTVRDLSPVSPYRVGQRLMSVDVFLYDAPPLECLLCLQLL